MRKKTLLNLVIYIVIFISVFSFILPRQIGNLDEIWNYNFAKNVAEGRIPYRDFNMLQMPILPIICGLILKLTVNQLFIMRILATFLGASVVFIFYKIYDELSVKKTVIAFYLICLTCLYKDVFFIDYNWASLFIVLLIIYIEIKNNKKKNKEDLLKCNNIWTEIGLGILGGLDFNLKQTSGFLICIAVVANKLLYVKNKEQLKEYLKIVLIRIIGILIPITLIILYLIINNSFGEFINYTLKGAKGFSNYISYKVLFEEFSIVTILAIIVPIYFIYGILKCKKRK